MTAKNIKQLPTRSKKVKKGDNVVVIAGKDKGKTGEILKVMPKDAKVVVSGVNLRKKHQKPSMNSSGGIVEKESPLDISNIAIVDPKTGKPTKVGFKVLENGAKVRFAKLSGTLLDQDK